MALATKTSSERARPHRPSRGSSSAGAHAGALTSPPHQLLRREAACACGGGCPRCSGALSQPRLTISAPGDSFEQEAGRAAEAVAGGDIGPALQQALKADRPVVIDVVSDIDALAPVAVTE